MKFFKHLQSLFTIFFDIDGTLIMTNAVKDEQNSYLTFNELRKKALFYLFSICNRILPLNTYLLTARSPLCIKDICNIFNISPHRVICSPFLPTKEECIRNNLKIREDKTYFELFVSRVNQFKRSVILKASINVKKVFFIDDWTYDFKKNKKICFIHV